VVVSISQSNHPVRVFAGQGGFLFILPDGTLWSWGRQGIISPPQQVGTNRDWTQVSARYRYATVGLRSNGTLWSGAGDSDEPKQFGSDHDWVEVCAGNGYNFARKRDGTLWGWGNNNQNQLGNGPGPNHPEAVRVGTNHNWKDINTSDFGALALRGDGTLWTWGNLNYLTNGMWITTNSPIPIQFCRESNWVALSDGLEKILRNQAGESWGVNDPLTVFPGASVPIASMGHLLSSNAAATAFGPLFTTNWNYARYEVRSNGTLWAIPSSLPPASAPLAPPLRVGQRSDWVSVWGAYQSMIGTTSDGTVWT
jgi:alpha-tubulin suppressor-like RCC1 family protein